MFLLLRHADLIINGGGSYSSRASVIWVGLQTALQPQAEICYIECDHDQICSASGGAGGTAAAAAAAAAAAGGVLLSEPLNRHPRPQ